MIFNVDGGDGGKDGTSIKAPDEWLKRGLVEMAEGVGEAIGRLSICFD